MKDKVSPGLQNLCVSVLDDSREDMERAVEGITEYTSKHNSFILKRKIDQASTERSRIIAELAAVRRKLYSVKFQECNTIVLNGESISPTKAAQFVAENADQLDYIPGRVENGHTLPLSLEELTRLYYSNSLITQDDEIELNCNIPSRDEIPYTEEVRALHEKLENACEMLKTICFDGGYEPTVENSTGELFIKGRQGEFCIPEYRTVNTEEVNGLIEKIPTFEEWMIFAAIDGKRGGVYKSRWQLLEEKIKATVGMSEAFIGERFGKEILFSDPVRAEEAYPVYAQMKEQYEIKGNLKTLGIFMPKQFSMALEYVVINGKKISCADDCSLILKEIDLRKSREECSRFWNELLVSHGAPEFMSLDPYEPEREAVKWIPIIESALALYTSLYQKVRHALEKINLSVEELFAIGQTESDDIQTRKIITGITSTLPQVIKIIICEQEISESKRNKDQMISVFSQDERRNSAICQKAIKAISNADAEEYLPVYNKICNLYDKYELQRERENSLRKLEVIAPDWAMAIRRRMGIHGHADVPPRILDAWKWKQYVLMLDELSEESFEELQRKSSLLSRQYRECTATLAELKAWYHLTIRTEADLTLKQNLQGWAQTVRRIGKGTGKSAPKYRAEARRLMAKCQRAVPAWIMPMNKAIETLEPKNNLFDIVIIDEASQSDLSAFAVAYMARKIIVVGDDRQVSPMAIGVKDEELNSLASMYIKDVIFINMYLQEVRTLVKHGIKSAYVAREDNLKFYKGKLVVNEQIKQNAAHGERFYVRYDEYLVDRAENLLVKATLLKLQRITGSAENQKEIRQLLTAFEMVSPSVNYQKDFSKVVIDRNTKDYDMLMRWSRVFLLNKSFTTFSGGHNARALLFPMEKVFESYVARQLKKVLLDLDWEFSAQDKGYYLFDSPRQFALRPDIVITRGDGSKIILDTKWKSLIDKPRLNYGISQADMYQMYAYSKKYETPEIWLLYPVNEEMRSHPDISFDSDDGVNVRLFFVDVANIETSLQSLRDQLL